MFVVISAIVGTVVSQCLVVEEKVSAKEKAFKAEVDAASKRKRLEIAARVLASPVYDDEFKAEKPELNEFAYIESLAFQEGEAFLTHEEYIWWVELGSPSIDAEELKKVAPLVKFIEKQQPARRRKIAELNAA